MGEKKLSGKVALITGGARGLGRGYALRLAALGADIAIVDRNLKASEVYAFEKEQLTRRLPSWTNAGRSECGQSGCRSI
jgi:NAD(P)-dependent dehydrogenase (short-subunit alcohol dehydrogenase family)